MAFGIDTIVEGVSATTLGRRSRARTRGQLAIAADAPGGNGKKGQAQISFIPLTRQTTNATEAVAGTTANGGNSHILLAQQCVGYQMLVTAYEDATGDSKQWLIIGAMNRRAAGNNLHVGGSAPTRTVVAQDAGAAAWTCRVEISTNILVLRVTGEAGKTSNWGAKVDLVEVGAF